MHSSHRMMLQLHALTLACWLLMLVFCLFSEHAHALNWAIVDVKNQKYYADPILDRSTPEILKRQLEDGSYDLDERMRRAFIEIVNKGQTAQPPTSMQR